MAAFLRRQWLLIALLSVIGFGFCLPHWFATFANAKSVRNGIVATVLFVMALPLDTRSVAQSIRHPWAAIYASFVNVGVLPIIAWLMAQLLTGDMQKGLLVTAAVPCTLASAAVWTRRAGGDDTVSILVTSFTNLTCFLTIPFWLYVMTGHEMSVEDRSMLMRMPLRLGMLVVLPMAAAQLLRQIDAVGEWATKQKGRLSSMSQIGILSMVLAGSTICGRNIAESELAGLSGIPLMCVVAVVLHLTVFTFGFISSGKLGFNRKQQIAVGISGSQKTLMVGLEIAITYVGGLAILPMVVYHIGQLLADTLLADWLRSRNT